MKNLLIIFNVLTLIALVSCKYEAKNEAHADESLMKISKEQFDAENMKLGKIEKAVINEKIAFTGKIIPKINAIAKISIPVPGKILSVQIKDGQHVQANEILLKIGGSELIDLQQDFASSSAKIKQLKTSYDKEKQLFEENIKTETEYLLAESNYKVELANYSALKAKLQNIGLDIANIENGKYASQYCVKTPISGQISEIHIVNGQHINADSEILEVIDNSKIELQLSLFEKDLEKIQTGQNIRFWGIEKGASESAATINRIGGKLNPNSNTINCYASISGNSRTYAINQTISGEIIVSSDSVLALPQTAVFAVGRNHYVLIKNAEDESNYLFEKKKIDTGKSSDDYIEILEVAKEEILISGTYNIDIE